MLAAVWGFAEGTFFFFLPDILFTATALFSVRASLRQVAGVLAGALAGGALLFSYAVQDHASARDAVLDVPFVRERMFQKVEADFADAGVWAMCKGPMSGVPYKVYAVSAPAHLSMGAFLWASIPARMERFAITWMLFAAIGRIRRSSIQCHPRRALAGHAVFWIAVYAYYWPAIGLSR